MSTTVKTNNWANSGLNGHAQKAYEALQKLCEGNTAEQPFGIGWHTIDALAITSGLKITAVYRCSAMLTKMPGVRSKTFKARSSGIKVRAFRYDTL